MKLIPPASKHLCSQGVSRVMSDLEAIFSAEQAYLTDFRVIRPNCCPLHSDLACALEETAMRFLEEKRPYAFVMRPYDDSLLDMENAARDILSRIDGFDFFIARNHGYEEEVPVEKRDIATILAKDEGFVGHGYCHICRLALFADFGIAELATLNPNVLLEIGLMYGFGKTVILTLECRITRLDELPFDLLGEIAVPYENYPALCTGLQRQVKSVVEQLKRRYL